MLIMIGKTHRVSGVGVAVACLVIVGGWLYGGCAMGVTRTGQHDGGDDDQQAKAPPVNALLSMKMQSSIVGDEEASHRSPPPD